MTTITKAEAQELLKTPKKKEPKKEPPREYTFWDNGMSILELREVTKDILYVHSWYDNEVFAKETEKPCMRTISILPTNKTVDEHKAMLEKENLVKARQLAMLSVLLRLKGEEPIEEMVSGWIRCADKTSVNYRVGLHWHDGRLRVSDNWVVSSGDNVWFSSVRTS